MTEHFICIPGPREIFDVDSILERLPVRSPYGIHQKNTMAVYAPGDEDCLRFEFARIALIMESIDRKDYWVWECEGLLGKLLFIDEALDAASRGYVLTIEQISRVMHTCSLVGKIRALAGHLSPDLAAMAAPKLSKSLFKLMDLAGVVFPDGTPRFESQAGHSYRESLEEQQRLVKAMRDEYMSLVGMIEESTGLIVTPGGTIRVSRLDESLVDYLDRTVTIKRHLESANYIIYILRKSGKWQELVERVKVLRLKVSRHGEDCRREFSVLVGETRAEFERILSELGHLDLLIAKARFGAGFGGVCPLISDDSVLWVSEGENMKDYVRAMDSPLFNCRLGQGMTLIADRRGSRSKVLMSVLARLIFGAHMGVPVSAREMETGLYHFICHMHGPDMADESRLEEALEQFMAVTNREGRGLFLLDGPGETFPAGFASAFVQALLERVRPDRDLVILTTRDSQLPAKFGKNACFCLEIDDDDGISRSEKPCISLILWNDYKSRNKLVEVVTKSSLGKDVEQQLRALWNEDDGTGLTRHG